MECIKQKDNSYLLIDENGTKMTLSKGADKSITINYLNLDKLSEEELSSLYTSYQSFVDNGIGTPTLLLVSNSEVKMFKRGYTNKESLIELLKENKFIS